MVTLTSEQGKLLHAINSIDFVGSHSNILSAIQVAQLVLKHRQNANQKQRIVVFAGSPLKADMAAVERINLMLRKNNISIDAVSFGNVEANEQILAGLLQTDEDADEDDRVNHFVRVVPGQGSLVQAISQTTMARRGGDGEGTADFEFGVDPEMDPELAMALKLSMQEEEERQARAAAASGKQADEPRKDMEIDQQEAAVDEEDEDALLQQAIALSMETAKKEAKE
jgi:26S proteasome regulatory subunit N10